MTKREDTTKASILLSVIAMNVHCLAMIFLDFIFMLLYYPIKLLKEIRNMFSKLPT